jgi:hypothetical protein
MMSQGENAPGRFSPGRNGGGTFSHGGNATPEFSPGANPTEGSEDEEAASDVVSRKRKRRVGGRPRKETAERRTTKFTVSVNEAEKATIEEAASAAGLAPAVYLREVGVGSRMSKRTDDVLYHRLSRIGVRLQHLARCAEREGRAEERAALEALLQEVIDVRATL